MMIFVGVRRWKWNIPTESYPTTRESQHTGHDTGDSRKAWCSERHWEESKWAAPSVLRHGGFGASTRSAIGWHREPHVTSWFVCKGWGPPVAGCQEAPEELKEMDLLCHYTAAYYNLGYSSANCFEEMKEIVKWVGP